MTLKVKNIKTVKDASRDEQRKFVKNVSDTLVNVHFESIVVRKCGDKMLNPRTYFEGIEELAHSIDSIGLTHPITVKVQADGTAFLLDGERRFRAVSYLRGLSSENKARFATIQAKIAPKDMTETDMQLLILSTQSAESFNPLDEAEAYNRLKTGWMGEKPLSLTEIATRIGKPVAHVESRLLLLKTSPKEREAINKGATTVTAVTHMIRKEPDPAKREAKIEDANKKGRVLQVKDVKRSDLQQLVEQQLDILKEIQTSVDFSLLSDDMQAWIQEVDMKAREILKLG